MDEMLYEIGIDDLVGQVGKNDSYVIDLSSDSEWGRVYSLLEKCENVYQLEENNLLTTHNASLQYVWKDDYQITLKADFDNELYSIVFVEV